MELDESVKKIEAYNHIDWKKKLDINKNMMLAKGYIYDEIGHPNLNGQYFIARSILKTLNIDEKTIPDFIKTIL